MRLFRLLGIIRIDLGFNGFIWSQAVIVEVYTLGILTFALTLALLMVVLPPSATSLPLPCLLRFRVVLVTTKP